jgi:hypothetical protein
MVQRCSLRRSKEKMMSLLAMARMDLKELSEVAVLYVVQQVTSGFAASMLTGFEQMIIRTTNVHGTCSRRGGCCFH